MTGYQKFFIAGFAILIYLFSLSSAYAALSTAPVKIKSEQFLSIADLHFNPFLSCDAQPCPFIKKLKQMPASQWGSIFSQHDTSKIEYGKDSNYLLLESSLDAIKKVAQKTDVQFVLMIGDLLAHNFHQKYLKYAGDKTKAGYISFVKKTLEFLTAEFKRTLPNTDIYLAIGNNDSYQNDYTSEPDGLFFKDFSHISSTLINNPHNKLAMQRELPHAGYYACNSPYQPQLRLIMLNSVLFSTKAQGPHINQAAQEELDWFHHELITAGKKHQRVLIAMHIPTGIDVYTSLFNPFRIIEFWKSPYSQRFLTEIQQSAPQIMGVFTGHIHADSFQLLMTENHRAVPFTGTPSISPIFGNNPGFKIYSYIFPTFKLSDFVTYYYSLNNEKKWDKEYDFDEVYQLNHHGSEIINGMKRLQPAGKLAEQYKAFYAVNTDSQPITKKWFPYYWCAIRILTPNKYRDCIRS